HQLLDGQATGTPQRRKHSQIAAQADAAVKTAGETFVVVKQFVGRQLYDSSGSASADDGDRSAATGGAPGGRHRLRRSHSVDDDVEVPLFLRELFGRHRRGGAEGE